MRETWYAEGLKFTCTQCGNCCSGAPGYVFVTREEIVRIAGFLNSGDRWLGKEHLRRVGLRYSLTEVERDRLGSVKARDQGGSGQRNGDCCFLAHKNGKRVCGIYPVRPLQCRTWPFWDANLASSDDWAHAAADCPGMNRGAQYDYVQIEIRRAAKRTEELPA